MSPFLTTLGGGSVRGFGRGRKITAAVFVAAPGQQLYGTPGTYSFTVPAGVTSISACVVGGGGGSGYYSGPYSNSYPWGAGAGGGALAYANNVSVSPGDVLTVVVGVGGAPLTRFSSAGQTVTAYESNASNKGGNSYITLANSSVFVEAGGGKAPGSVNSPTLEGGGTDYAYDGGGGAFIAGTAGYSGGAGGSSKYSNNYSTGGGGGGAGGYTGAGGLGGRALASNAGYLSNTFWRAGATSTGGGGGGGAGQGWEQTLPVGNRQPTPSGPCAGYNNTDFTTGGGGGGVGLKGLGANGIGATMVGGGGGGGSGGSSALSPPNFGTAAAADYGGGAGGNDPYQYIYQTQVSCIFDYDTYQDVCTSTCETVYVNSGTTSLVGGVAGGSGGVRIMWGTGRSYPSNAADV